MADLDEDAIVVTLPDDGDGTVITEIKPEGKTAPVEAQNDPIADLKGQFDTLKNTHQSVVQRLSTAEQQLTAKDQEIAKVRSEVTSSQLDTVVSGIQAANAEAEAAERDFIAAAEAGDFAAQARAQRKISAAEARIQRLTEAKGDLEEVAKTKPAPQTETRSEPRQEPVDRVELFAKSMSPRSAAWIRSHPDCVTDPKKNALMLAAHNLAIAHDIAIDSDEYFQRIEAGIMGTQPTKTDTKIEPKTESGAGKRPMSAAASGASSTGGMNGGAQEVRLTAREVAAANDGTVCYNYDDPKGKFKKGDPIGTTEFARRKMIMQKQGLYDRGFIES